MKKTMFSALGMAALIIGCAPTDTVTKNTINQEMRYYRCMLHTGWC